MNRLEAAITTWLPEEGLFKDLHKYPQVSISVSKKLSIPIFDILSGCHFIEGNSLKKGKKGETGGNFPH